MMGVKVKWLTNSAFEISYKGKTLTFDPSVRFMAYEGLCETSYEKPDYVFVSHLHWDHISELRYLYKKYAPKVLSGPIGRRELVNYLNANAADVFPAWPGTALDFGFFKVDFLTNLHRDGKKTLGEQVAGCKSKCDLIDDQMFSLQETGSLEMCNYLLTFDNGYRILIWGGEFGVTQENLLKDLHPDLALMQFSSSRKDEFLSMVEAVSPKAVIPYHHDFSAAKDKWLPVLMQVRKECPCSFVILDNCETYAE